MFRLFLFSISKIFVYCIPCTFNIRFLIENIDYKLSEIEGSILFIRYQAACCVLHSKAFDQVHIGVILIKKRLNFTQLIKLKRNEG